MRLLVCALVRLNALSLTKAEARAERKPLLIANWKYKNQSRLQTPPKDMKFLKKKLRSLGYQVTVEENLRAGELDNVVGDYAEVLTADDEVYFHYAGHGLELGGSTMLLGVDFDARDARDDPEARGTVYPLDAPIDRLSTAKAAVVVIDKCRHNRVAPSYVVSKNSHQARL